MQRCKKCKKLGLFRSINPNTGICLECEQKSLSSPVAPMVFPTEPTLKIPKYYVGNGMRYLLTDSFKAVSIETNCDIDYSKLKLCHDVSFSDGGNGIDVSLKFGSLLGKLCDVKVSNLIRQNIEKKIPIFSQISGFDSEKNVIDLCIAFYKIENFDYSPEHDKHFDDIDPDDIAFC